MIVIAGTRIRPEIFPTTNHSLIINTGKDSIPITIRLAAHIAIKLYKTYLPILGIAPSFLYEYISTHFEKKINAKLGTEYRDNKNIIKNISIISIIPLIYYTVPP
jgi:hypothetical protein